MIRNSYIQNAVAEVNISEKGIKKIANVILQQPVAIEKLLTKYGYILPKNYSVAKLNNQLAKAIVNANPQFIKEINALINGGYSSVDPITISAIIGGLSSIFGGLTGKKSKSEQEKDLEKSLNQQIIEAQKQKEKQQQYILYGVIGFATLFTIVGIAVLTKSPAPKIAKA